MDKLIEYLDSEVQKRVDILIKKETPNFFKKIKCQHLLWHSIHLITYLYPTNPTDDERIMFADFFVLYLKNAIPFCNQCRKHYEEAINEADLNFIFMSKINLMTFFINLHNKITLDKLNTDVEKNNYKEYTFQDVFNFYEQNDFSEYFKKSYDFDILELLNKKEYNTIVNKLKFV
jgi:hypothetical protein